MLESFQQMVSQKKWKWSQEVNQIKLYCHEWQSNLTMVQVSTLWVDWRSVLVPKSVLSVMLVSTSKLSSFAVCHLVSRTWFQTIQCLLVIVCDVCWLISNNTNPQISTVNGFHMDYETDPWQEYDYCSKLLMYNSKTIVMEPKLQIEAIKRI